MFKTLKHKSFSIFRKGLPLQVKITLLSFALIVLIVISGGAILIENFSRTLEGELGSRALAIARTVAQMEEIQNHVGMPEGEVIIQPVAEKVRLATNVEYIVVMDMDRIRYSHPLQDRIGEKFAGGDEAAALANHQYISNATGVLGPSLRAFVPIKTEEGTRQVGVVVVGILTPTLATIIREIRHELYLSLAMGLFLGMLGSILLSKNIKKTMFNMEPEEISRFLEEREAVFQSIDEGIIAIDRDEKITLINKEAKRLLGVEKDITGESIRKYIPHTRLPQSTITGKAEYNREVLVKGTRVLANRIPIRVKDETVGAVATFKDKSEVRKLAEELTGVKKFIEGLRVQNHEYMNKLHTIAGLIQLDKKQEAVDYIFAITEEQQELTSFLTKNIQDYRIAGLLLGKYSRAKELKIEMLIDPKSKVKKLPLSLDSSALVIILGNLLENAMEALSNISADRKKIYLSLKETSSSLSITVEDLGPGIERKFLNSIFKKGFTTKGETNQGLGLYLVREHIINVGGDIKVESSPQKGTKFIVFLPYNKK